MPVPTHTNAQITLNLKIINSLWLYWTVAARQRRRRTVESEMEREKSAHKLNESTRVRVRVRGNGHKAKSNCRLFWILSMYIHLVYSYDGLCLEITYDCLPLKMYKWGKKIYEEENHTQFTQITVNKNMFVYYIEMCCVCWFFQRGFPSCISST